MAKDTGKIDASDIQHYDMLLPLHGRSHHSLKRF